jgi:hypothetical protein
MEKTKKRVISGSHRASLVFADELLVNDDIDFMNALDDTPIEASTNFNRRKSMGRRRSSVAFLGGSLGDEQNAQIADMYKTVIQLSTEGVITKTNHNTRIFLIRCC